MSQWGVIGLGRNAINFIKGLKNCPGTKLLAVASVSDQAIEIFKKNNPDILTYNNYEELLDHPDLDAVYIALSSEQHYKYTMIALEKNIPVITKAPSAFNVKQFDDIIEASQKNHTIYLEGLRTRFFPCYHQLKKDVLSLGLIKEIHCNINQNVVDVDTYNYPIGFAMGIIDSTLRNIDLLEDDLDRIVLTFRSDCDLYIERTNSSILACKIIGENGSILINDYICPREYTIIIKGQEVTREFEMKHDLYYIIEAIELCRTKGLLEHPDMTFKDTRQIIEIVEQIRKELVYE